MKKFWYKLIVEYPDHRERYRFKTWYQRDAFLERFWNDDADWLVPCSFGGWIDIRDMRW